MKRKNRLGTLAAACFLGSALLGSSEAFAQAPPLSESIVIGAWTFRPSLDARIRGEYRQSALDLPAGSVYAPDAIFADAPSSNLPPVGESRSSYTPPKDLWSIAERVRLGLAVDRGPVTAVLKLQDARVLGGSPAVTLGDSFVAPPGAGFAPYEAYVDLHARSGRPMFLRVGRQAVQWGDGRLIGTNDFTATGRSLDAARAGFEAGDFDFEGMAALLGYPYFGLAGSDSAAGSASDATSSTTGTGAQLYGLKITGHFLPLLQMELTGLARIVRLPLTQLLTPSDTLVGDLRIFGEHRGFRYSVEGAYEGGQVASYQKNRSIQALAVAGRLEWETALPAHLTFAAQGAYASGDSGTGAPDDAMTRFDPILPDQTANHSKMSLYTWSNLIEAGGDLSVRPLDELGISAGYRFVGLADPKGRWTTGALTTVGADPNNKSNILGHEVDATIRVTPWDPITFQAGYGLFLPGDGGKAILKASGRSEDMQSWGYLQVSVKAP